MTKMLITDKYEAAECFVTWLEKTVVARARGDDRTEIIGKPSDRFWLGRLAPTTISFRSGGDGRGERLEPCQIGIRLRPATQGPWVAIARVRFVMWKRTASGRWTKLNPTACEIRLTIEPKYGSQSFGSETLAASLQASTGRPDVSAAINTELSMTPAGRELVISFVNTSALDDGSEIDPRFYQADLEISGIETEPFLLDSLEDTFRYDRRVAAYGINCGVRETEAGFLAVDVPIAEKLRPIFWGGDVLPPPLDFTEIAERPVEIGQQLVLALEKWGAAHWSAAALDVRATAEGWVNEMREKARRGAAEFEEEVARVRQGVEVLSSTPEVRRAFVLMNRAMQLVGHRKGYTGWRAFQLGFLLANLRSLVDGNGEWQVVDIVWFATGGGKTETYLGLLTTAAFLDRLRGKPAGITAWSRFPLRMLSLQQMQRFADAMAAAEIVRRRENIGGAPFSVGFLVGDGASPNKVRRPEQDRGSRYDPDDPNMPGRFRLLQQCPFCASPNIGMKFDFETWMLQHRCRNADCAWPEKGLPFYIVDEEVYRVLPTVVVGTLDKAASIGLQQAMRGLVAPPRGICPRHEHGFTYNPSSKAPTGCLVPDCTETPNPLPFDGALFPPSFRLQDELHLLRDSLGAVDAHYESVLDGLQGELTGRGAKILASSATLSGYDKQALVLYHRRARVFPQPGPSAHEGFWSKPGNKLMRRYLAIAPRGATIEFAIDRLLNDLQCAVRELKSDPTGLCARLGIDPSLSSFLLSQYGTNVVYGSTLRDLDAVSRSSGTQLVDIEGPVNEAALTGRTQFEEVSAVLDRLQKADEAVPFEERIHIVMASSMMSHGVDVDRLNAMIVLGMPLTTAEFIQATARVGRKWPSLVFVVHKMGRERDAGVFRSFEKFIEQGDRFVEPIPITGRSRRVLERTMSGLGMARLLHVHAAASADRFTTVAHLRAAIRNGTLSSARESEALVKYLAYDAKSEEEHIGDIYDGLQLFFEAIDRPSTKARDWYGNIWPIRPMMSLRDVEEQVIVHLRREE